MWQHHHKYSGQPLSQLFPSPRQDMGSKTLYSQDHAKDQGVI